MYGSASVSALATSIIYIYLVAKNCVIVGPTIRPWNLDEIELNV